MLETETSGARNSVLMTPFGTRQREANTFGGQDRSSLTRLGDATVYG